MKNWYAVYTAPRAEKKISERLADNNIEHYLPLQSVMRQWSDRKKKVIVPVIHGYIFVCIEKEQMMDVLRTYGIACFVRNGKEPAIIPQKQIERLKFMVNNADMPIEFSITDMQPGDAVIITRGNLKGMIGELVEIQGKYKVVMRIDNIGCAAVTINAGSIEKVN